jgi:hypothetical protein
MGYGACISIAFSASVVLLAAAHTSLKVTTSLTSRASIARFATTYEQELCIQKKLRTAVPKGARIYVEGGNQQMLWMGTPWAHPVQDGSSSQFIVLLQPGNQCYGLLLSIRHTR